jgi:hypothetical protein
MSQICGMEDPFKWRGICHLLAKLPAISHPFPLGVARIVLDVGAPGGAGGNFQSWLSTISQHGCSTYCGASHQGPIEEEVGFVVLLLISLWGAFYLCFAGLMGKLRIYGEYLLI